VTHEENLARTRTHELHLTPDAIRQRFAKEFVTALRKTATTLEDHEFRSTYPVHLDPLTLDEVAWMLDKFADGDTTAEDLFTEYLKARGARL
jgi:hypothetical protein